VRVQLQEQSAQLQDLVVHIADIKDKARSERTNAEDEIAYLEASLAALTKFCQHAVLTQDAGHTLEILNTHAGNILKRQEAEGLTQTQMMTELRSLMNQLPEPEILGDYAFYVLEHQDPGKSAEFAIKKQMLRSHFERTTTYLIATNCFTCPCGTKLQDRARRLAAVLCMYCPICLVQPYCDSLCAARHRPQHALVCHPHQAWLKNSTIAPSFPTLVSLTTKAKQTPAQQSPFPPALQTPTNTFSNTTLQLMCPPYYEVKHGKVSLARQHSLGSNGLQQGIDQHQVPTSLHGPR
jgi:hypothetical protein